jgi:polyhydroxyalkanoate synthesis regulator phasin
MSKAQSDGPGSPKASAGSGAEAVGDALRSAVERTLAATADSATGTRDRAQGLLDDVVRRGQSAREQMTKRGEEATNRLADAIADLRAADGADLERLAERLGAVEARVRALVSRTAPGQSPSEGEHNPQVEVDDIPADRPDQRDSEA